MLQKEIASVITLKGNKPSAIIDAKADDSEEREIRYTRDGSSLN